MISTALRAVYFEIRVPDGIMSAYAPVMIQYTPSPARFMSMIDPLLPVGILMRCLAGKVLHTVYMIQYTPSPARFMSMIDPLLPVGILMRCLAGKFLQRIKVLVENN